MAASNWPFGAQQIGQIDDRLGAAGILGQHPAEELFGGARQAQLAGGIAQGKQHLGIVGLKRQRLLELGDGFGMPSLGRQLQAGLIGDVHGAAAWPKAVKSRLKPVLRGY